MALRYLFGLVSAHFAQEYLHGERQAGRCLCFNAAGTADLTIGPGDDWEQVTQRLPAGGQPDFIVLALGHGNVPPCL